MKNRQEEYSPTELEEAGIHFLFPEKKVTKDEKKKIGKSMSVFYNPRMTINRDLTLCIVETYAKQRNEKISYCDSMAATGIRSLRLLKNFAFIEKVFINDINPIAVETIKKNLDLNEIPSDQYTLSSEDTKLLLTHFHERTNSYLDIIDIDPFGSPSEFIPPAMYSIAVGTIGGLLCVTATDTPVLFGIKKEACIRKYLTAPIRTEFKKEMGTRILIYYIAKIAHLFELYIEPVLSVSANHFVRVFVLIKKGILGVNSNLQKFGYYLYCKTCQFRSAASFDYETNTMIDRICPNCGNKLISSGLVWMGNLHSDHYFSMLENQLEDPAVKKFPSFNRIKKFVELAKDENKMPPYFYSIPKIADSMNYIYPSPLKIMEKLREGGFIASRTHFEPQSIKTDAPIEILKGVLQEFQY